MVSVELSGRIQCNSLLVKMWLALKRAGGLLVSGCLFI